MSRNIDLDKSRKVRIRARVNESSVPKVFTFLNSDGSAHDISSYNFKFLVYRSVGSILKLFTLSVGSGLTVQGDDNNELLLEIDADQATQTPDTYFFRLYSTEEDHTWLNGPFEFHNGEFDSDIEETEVTIGGDEGVTIEITGSGGGLTEGVPQKQGVWTSDAIPTTSGVDEDGTEIKDGYFWLIGGSVGVTIFGVYLVPGTFLWANQDSPTDDFSITGWKFF